MKKHNIHSLLLFSSLLFFLSGCKPGRESLEKTVSPADLVNVFIGTDEGGNTSPAAYAPFGMISCGPTNLFGAGDEFISRAGYWYSKDTIAWFSLTHVSGWGCNGALDIPFMPVTGIPQKNPIYHPAACSSAFSHDQEKAGPGYYEVFLKDYRVNLRAAVSERACITNIQYPAGKQNVLVFSPASCANGVTASQIHIDTTENLLTGSATSGGFCSRNPALYDYTVYFAARFNRKVSAYGGWNGNNEADPATQISGDSVAAWVAFGTGDTVPLEMKIAISFVSIENAMLNLAKETNGMDLASLKAQTTEKWNNGLAKMEAETSDTSLKIQLYTALYHNMLHPNIFEDVNGQYRGFNDSVYTINPGHHKYVSFSNWDTYRTTAQLQGLLFPSRAADMIHSLYLDAMQGDPAGFPIWGYFNNETWIMNGYSGLPLIANLYAFGGRDIDLETIKNKMVWAADHKYSHGDDYIKYGYVPDYESNYNYSVSMTLEYAIDDFSVAEMCKYAGDSVNYHRFLKRSLGVFKLFNTKTGYLQRKDKGGNWVEPFDSASEIGFNEGNAAQYTWNIPHALNRLVEEMGGNKKTIQRLDYFTSRILTEGWNVDVPFFWPANQPSFIAPFVYSYAGAPEKAQALIRHSLNTIFSNSPGGLPGNDDLGATSAMYLFEVAGVYPLVPGVPEFTLTGCLADRIRFRLDNGGSLTIVSHRSNGSVATVKQIKINGKSSDSYFMKIDDLINNGKDITVEFFY